MIKKVLKIIMWIFIGIVGLLLLISILVYLPSVQKFIIGKASSYVESNLGMKLDVERFRLHFPLTLEIDNTMVRTAGGDTLASFSELRAGIRLLPLLRGKVETGRIGLKEAAVHYRDTLGGLELRGRLDNFVINSVGLDLQEQAVDVRKVALSDADIELWLGESHKADTVESSPMLWEFDVDRVDLSGIVFRMHTSPQATELTAELGRGSLDKIFVDLGGQQVDVRSVVLENGDYRFLTDTLSAPVVAEPVTESAVPALPWTVNVARVDLVDNAGVYGSIYGGEPARGFDPSHIEVTALNLKLDSVYYSGSDISANINALRLRERSGLEIADAEGRLAMDSTQIALSGFTLRTAALSRITANARVATSRLNMSSDASLSVAVNAALNASDIFKLYPVDDIVRRTIGGRTLTVGVNASGTLDNISLNTLTAALPGSLSLRASGRVRSVMTPEKMSGNVNFNGDFHNIDFVREFIPDTTTRNRIGFPDYLAMNGNVVIAGTSYAPDVTVLADSGRVELRGRLDTRTETYDLELLADKFPLAEFLPQDSLGMVTMNLTAAGAGFDPSSDGMNADVSLMVERFDYNGYNYRDISLDANLADHIVEGQLKSESLDLFLDLALYGEIYRNDYKGSIDGRIYQVDLYGMNFSDSPLSASLKLNAQAQIYPDSLYKAFVVLDSAFLTVGRNYQHLARTTLEAYADSAAVTANVSSGDLVLKFEAPVAVDSMIAGLSQTAEEIGRQIIAKNLDMEQIQDRMPPVRFEAKAGRNNILNSMLRFSGNDFNSIDAAVSTTGDRPFRGGLVVKGLRYGGLVLDTLNIGIMRKADSLNYFVRVRNRPGNIDQMALIVIYGGAAGSEAQVNFIQRNRQGENGFRFGIKATLLDSAVKASIYPYNPLFAYKPWAINEDNYVTYRFDKNMFADLKLEGDDAHFYIQSENFGKVRHGGVKLDAAGINIGELLGLIPAPPPVGGMLATDLNVGFDGDLFSAQGTVGVGGLTYDKRSVGDLLLAASIQSDTLRRNLLDASLDVNGSKALTAKGMMASEGRINFSLDIPSFPLPVVNAFLPEDMAQLDGVLHAALNVRGTTEKMNMNGSMDFADGKLIMPVTGTTYGISTDKITLRNSLLEFNDFGMIAPNRQKFSLDGSVDLADFKRIYMDLGLYASNFEAVNSTASGGSQVYGKAYLDVDVTAQGTMDVLSVRGNVGVLSSTDVTYVLRDSPLEVQSQKQDIVTFVSFRDTAALAALDSMRQERPFGIDMLVNVDILDGVQARLNLSEDGTNRVELVGDGNLTYSMNTQNDIRFAGRYNLTGGTVVYHPPVISAKDFAINDDSYVEWTGEMLDPSLNITAVESLKTTVTTESTAEEVTFLVTIYIRNSLDNLDVGFDLSSNSQLIGPQLMAMTPEQRSQQALALLIYNTYTGPGASGTVDSNNAINSFIEKELNNWARNNLRGVDVSFGINDTNDAAGGQHTEYSYKVSKSLLDDRVKVTIGGNVNPTASAEANIKENFVDDISLEYRIAKRDNMFLKLYRYNTQESLLEGEVVETGGGFLVRKRMNHMNELFRLTRNPEKRAARRQKQTIRRQLREAERESGEDPAGEQRQDNPLAVPNEENEDIRTLQ